MPFDSATPLNPAGEGAGNEGERFSRKYNQRPCLYVYAYRFWALFFWIGCLLGSVHGLGMKGPVWFYKQLYDQDVINDKDQYFGPYTIWHGALGVAILVFFMYCEGYKGFQRAFSPRLVRRCWEYSLRVDLDSGRAIASWDCFESLMCRDSEFCEPESREVFRADEGGCLAPLCGFCKAAIRETVDFALAPLLVAGMTHATTKRLVVSWHLIVIIAGLIVGMKYTPSPWRNFVDLGVFVGLFWGNASIVCWTVAIGCCGGRRKNPRKTSSGGTANQGEPASVSSWEVKAADAAGRSEGERKAQPEGDTCLSWIAGDFPNGAYRAQTEESTEITTELAVA